MCFVALQQDSILWSIFVRTHQCELNYCSQFIGFGNSLRSSWRETWVWPIRSTRGVDNWHPSISLDVKWNLFTLNYQFKAYSIVQLWMSLASRSRWMFKLSRSPPKSWYINNTLVQGGWNVPLGPVGGLLQNLGLAQIIILINLKGPLTHA
jgi:hypothetical protein